MTLHTERVRAWQWMKSSLARCRTFGVAIASLQLRSPREGLTCATSKPSVSLGRVLILLYNCSFVLAHQEATHDRAPPPCVFPMTGWLPSPVGRPASRATGPERWVLR
jgi:hypothetical protein